MRKIEAYGGSTTVFGKLCVYNMYYISPSYQAGAFLLQCTHVVALFFFAYNSLTY
jgi:hypothetical protein